MIRRWPHHEDDVENAAARWLARRDAGLTDAQNTEFERWKVSDPRHAATLTELELLWAEVGRPRRTGVAAAVRRECGLLQRRRRLRRAGLTVGVVAAVLFIAAMGPWRIAHELSPFATRPIVLLPERHTLPDGSVVELKEGATFAVNFSAAGSGSRRVTLLAGEAHFEVAKDEARPFIVTVGGVAVRAVGTAFSIDRGSERIDVVVTEGSVAVIAEEANGNKAPTTGRSAHPIEESSGPVAIEVPRSEWLLAAGNRIVLETAADGATPQLLPVAPAEIDERLAWRSPWVEFSRSSLPEVVHVVNRYSRVQFEIADADLDRVTLSGRFRADDPIAFARALERNFGLKAERGSDTTIILRRAR